MEEVEIDYKKVRLEKNGFDENNFYDFFFLKLEFDKISKINPPCNF